MRISIITVCYNAEKTIADTIKSIRAQDHTDYEHIIVDGASTDGTLEVVQRLRHDKLKVVSEPDRGLYDAMNKGITMAGGDLIGFLHSDDFFCRTDALSLVAATARANPDTGAGSAGLVIVDPDQTGRVRRAYGTTRFRRWMLRFGHMPPHPGFYARAAAFKAVGAFDTRYSTSSDFDWMTRFYYVHGMTSASLIQPVVAMRAGGLSTRGWKSMRAINTDIHRTLSEHGVETVAALIWSKYLVKAGQLLPTKKSFLVPDAVRWKSG